MSISRRVEDARRAFARGDLQAALEAHTPERIARSMRREHAEEHGAAGHAYISPRCV